jgi:5-methylcytosine-specific restriction protein A
MTLRPCIECGEPTDGAHCPEHTRPSSAKAPAAERGYDATWARLSRRARKLQPFCSDCGATDDLQADHSPEAWARKAAGKPIRLQDIDVVCGPCNRRRGAARPQQTTGCGQQTRLIAPTRGYTPPRPLQHPRLEAKSELHTEIDALRMQPANSDQCSANVTMAVVASPIPLGEHGADLLQDRVCCDAALLGGDLQSEVDEASHSGIHLQHSFIGISACVGEVVEDRSVEVVGVGHVRASGAGVQIGDVRQRVLNRLQTTLRSPIEGHEGIV